MWCVNLCSTNCFASHTLAFGIIELTQDRTSQFLKYFNVPQSHTSGQDSKMYQLLIKLWERGIQVYRQTEQVNKYGLPQSFLIFRNKSLQYNDKNERLSKQIQSAFEHFQILIIKMKDYKVESLTGKERERERCM